MLCALEKLSPCALALIQNLSVIEQGSGSMLLLTKEDRLKGLLKADAHASGRGSASGGAQVVCILLR